MAALLPVAEAQRRLFALAAPVDAETCPVDRAAGRWAADALPALRTQPAAPLSAMDGYAIRFADLPGPWQVIGESAAGHGFAGAVAAGQAVRIFTGASVPPGADSILIQEEAGRDGSRLTLTGEGPPRPGSNVRARGLDFTDGDLLIHAGERLTPARLALAMIAGHATLPVRRKIRVAILSTGDELVPPGKLPKPDQIPETNRPMLAAMLADLPVELIDLGILPDRQDVLEAAFRGLDCDLLVTTGGASVGDHDLVRPALLAAGAQLDFWKIALRPGKPVMAGKLGDTVVLGLPGNPVSVFVTATLFVRPLIAHLSGATDPLPPTRTMPLGEPLPATGARADYLRGEIIDGRAHAATIQDSSMLRALARATCLIVRPAGAPEAKIGDSAEILDIA